MFSRRTGWSLAANRLAAAVAARRGTGKPYLDLTISNPTRAGLEYPSREIADALAAAGDASYDPDPRGDREAREAVVRWYASRGLIADPGDVVLTPGTSESYGWLFKLLCDPGDAVLVPRPSYPLFEFLASLESVETPSYPLRYGARWDLDREALRRTLEASSRVPRSGDTNVRLAIVEAPRSGGPSEATAAVGTEASPSPRGAVARAIAVVNPNNPTGSYLSRDELSFLSDLALEHDLVLISDEVFSSYPVEAGTSPVSLIGSDLTPAFVLDGLSKSAGLPGMKVGWIVAAGPHGFHRDALSRLEVVADTYLSVGSPAQRALPRLIELGASIGRQIRGRIGANMAFLRAALGAGSPCEALRVEGGWSAVLRVPATAPEEELCLRLLEREDVLVQPGWFYDFESEAYLVVSLLAPEAVFAQGIGRILASCR